MLKEKLGAIQQPEAERCAGEVAVPDPAAEAPPVGEPAADAAPGSRRKHRAETRQPREQEEDFQLEPEAIVTPEVLSQMVKDNAEFGKLLEADPALKGQLYKTAREAAELKPYREIFPDLDSAKAAQTQFRDVVRRAEHLYGVSNREGTRLTLWQRLQSFRMSETPTANVLLENGDHKSAMTSTDLSTTSLVWTLSTETPKWKHV